MPIQTAEFAPFFAVVAGLVLLVATLLPLIPTDAWWIRIFDFPRSQIAVLLVIAIGVSLALLDTARLSVWAWLLVLTGALAYQTWRILPYTPLAACQVIRKAGDEASRVRLLTANVLMTNRNAKKFLALVRDTNPDIVLAAETDRWWDSQLAVLEKDYPFSIRRPQDNTYGMHMFSRLELKDAQLRFLVEDDVPSIHARVRLKSGAWFDLYAVHPKPPRPSQDTEERDAELLLVGKAVKRYGQPAIVAGDLNDVAWSHTTSLFQKISGLLDPRIGRGLYSTFHARYPGMRWPLDHIFHAKEFTLVGMRRLGYFGSDHFPMLVELCYSPSAAAVQDAPKSDSDDRREADEKIAQAR